MTDNQDGKKGPSLPTGDALTYSKYLKFPDLLSLQKPINDPPAHDEMLFIIIHQSYELWFKQIIFELDALVDYMGRDDLISSFRLLDRICEIFRVLIQQIDIIETMTPVEFNRFRANLHPASGFQSYQFRELELMAGANIEDYQKFSSLEPEWKTMLNTREERQNLKEAFLETLKRNRLLSSTSHDEVLSAISRIYATPEMLALQNLCEYLIRFDEQISLWRFRHVQMVERMIGMKPGTGGSLGVSYLAQTLKRRFFPELWEARTGMGGAKY